MDTKYDVVIVGSGVAGLFCALSLPQDKKILCISKDALEGCDSFLAQGGICMLRDDDDYDAYFEDTMRAGHYENRKESVEIMIKSSQDVIGDLVELGVEFEKKDGQFVFTKEGAHSNNRILFHADITGKEITSKLLARAKERENITLMAHTTMVDWVCQDNVCYGIVVADMDGKTTAIQADVTVLACGGLGGVYQHSTNYRHISGDALALAMYHNVRLENCDYVQIHPTTLYTKQGGRSFLISESVRGEGAVLRDKDGNRFTDELQPRDVVSKAIFDKMKEQGTDHVWLDFSPIPKEEILNHFPNIYQRCKEAGYDPLTDYVPVVPAQHYFMGGIYVDKDSKTTMEQLYAVGETSCNGVHGRNRLASNSLLESLVFAKRAAHDIANTDSFKKPVDFDNLVNMDGYEDLPSIMEYYHAMVMGEIEKEEKLRAAKEAI
ncbi:MULTISPECIES: L-aspartate oxidase [Pseudobutyrivibrio]|uniref:L-aspartate oxidase n=1 Tax=Pseudobutyrivibrio xylanivorans TaxID=185007 RepID=A0A6M0LLF9_PSEXY|nr:MULTISPECIES: L-aspartate oxidase [Pseudobutyrivibrio]NEX01721.1 L-aspartate oxidase [Pseudobutyrivibrio xylanivorans]SCY44123.1 L-aspartate oxidase [Pseudobutyrivibrio sp. AR14]SFR71188.1 L-aspartate oxidase [Pseudobutyrivibrio sp. NOR37]